MEAVIKAGADVNVAGADETTLARAISRGSPQCVFLSSSNVQKNAQDRDGGFVCLSWHAGFLCICGAAFTL